MHSLACITSEISETGEEFCDIEYFLHAMDQGMDSLLSAMPRLHKWVCKGQEYLELRKIMDHQPIRVVMLCCLFSP